MEADRLNKKNRNIWRKGKEIGSESQNSAFQKPILAVIGVFAPDEECGLGPEGAEEVPQIGEDAQESLSMLGIVEQAEGLAGIVEEASGVVEGSVDGAFVVGDTHQDREVERFLIDDPLQELFPLRVAGVLEEIEDGEGELPFLEVRAEGFAKLFLSADEVEAVVINLVGCAELHAELAQSGPEFVAHARNVARQIGGRGKERPGFHLDDAEVVGLGESEVEASLSLDDLALANSAGRFGDFAREGEVIELRGKHQGMREEGVAQQDSHAYAPLGVGSGHLTTGGSAVDDVVMDQGGHVDELQNRAEHQVVGLYSTGGTTDEGGQSGADSLSGRVADIRNIGLHTGVEGPDLITESRLDLPEFALDSQKW